MGSDTQVALMRLMFIGGGLLLVLDLKRPGLALITAAALLPFRRLFLQVFLAHVPPSAVPAVEVILLFVAGLVVLQTIASLILGREAAAHMAGSLAADAVRIAIVAVVLLPFRVIRTILGTVFGRIALNLTDRGA